jgi:hypothetical protein
VAAVTEASSQSCVDDVKQPRRLEWRKPKGAAATAEGECGLSHYLTRGSKACAFPAEEKKRTEGEVKRST